jgi:hypothetical protein
MPAARRALTGGGKGCIFRKRSTMPARSERITIVPAKDGRPVRSLRFPSWWDRGAFSEKFKAREIDTGNPIDWNLAWLLSAPEAAAWNERCRGALPSAPIAASPAVQEEARQLEALLRDAAWVIVESVEWESGLD